MIACQGGWSQEGGIRRSEVDIQEVQYSRVQRKGERRGRRGGSSRGVDRRWSLGGKRGGQVAQRRKTGGGVQKETR